MFICGQFLALILCLCAPANAVIPPYSLVGSFTLPTGAWDVSPIDGRVWRMQGDDIYRQTALNAPTYAKIGSLPAGTVNSFGASFIRVGIGGFGIAIGDGNFDASASVYLVGGGTLNPSVPSAATRYIMPNYDARWSDLNRLWVTGADTDSVLTRLDFGVATPAPVRVMTGIGSASGGIAFSGGQAYVGSGYVPTGQIRTFSMATLGAVGPIGSGGAGGAPVAFSSGNLFGSVLSASPLSFDGLGNLLAGGGDSFSGTSDFGYAAVVDPTNPANQLHLAPAGPSALYSIDFDRFTNELLVVDVYGGTAYRYSVPGVGTGGVVLAFGCTAWLRRRRT